MDNKITILNSEGKEIETEIIFTYENEKRKTNYVFIVDPENDENVLVFKYFEETKELQEIEDDEEFNEAQEVFECYNSDPEIEKIK